MPIKDPAEKAAYMKQYQEKNKERLAAQKKKWREKNKEEQAAYREKNKEKRLANAKKWREENRERAIKNSSIYNKTLKGRYSSYKHGAKTRNMPFDISLEYFSTYWQKPCYYCGDPIDTIGIDRINNDFGYEEGNLRSCCSFCNRAKMDNTEAYFKDKILKIAAKYLEEK